MVCCLTLTIDKDIGTVSVGSEQDSILVDVSLGEPRTAVDCLEQGVGDAVGETDKINVSFVLGPVRKQREDEFHCRALRVTVVVFQGDEANVTMFGSRDCSGRRHDG